MNFPKQKLVKKILDMMKAQLAQMSMDELRDVEQSVRRSVREREEEGPELEVGPDPEPDPEPEPDPVPPPPPVLEPAEQSDDGQ